MIAIAERRTIENEELLELLPHRGKMLLISRIKEYDINARYLKSEYDIRESCLFFDPALEGVPAYTCFEFMAQAVSALSGLTGKYHNKPPMVGFILSVTSLKIEYPLFKSGDTVAITVNEEQKLDNVAVFQCGAVIGNNEAVRAKLMVMDIEDPKDFIRNDGK
jgi:predicted hotdog family 3-hydroxylacyl-ACP dehydratase